MISPLQRAEGGNQRGEVRHCVPPANAVVGGAKKKIRAWWRTTAAAGDRRARPDGPPESIPAAGAGRAVGRRASASGRGSKRRTSASSGWARRRRCGLPTGTPDSPRLRQQAPHVQAVGQIPWIMASETNIGCGSGADAPPRPGRSSSRKSSRTTSISSSVPALSARMATLPPHSSAESARAPRCRLPAGCCVHQPARLWSPGAPRPCSSGRSDCPRGRRAAGARTRPRDRRPAGFPAVAPRPTGAASDAHSTAFLHGIRVDALPGTGLKVARRLQQAAVEVRLSPIPRCLQPAPTDIRRGSRHPRTTDPAHPRSARRGPRRRSARRAAPRSFWRISSSKVGFRSSASRRMTGIRTSKVRRANDPGSEFMMSGGTAAGSAARNEKPSSECCTPPGQDLALLPVPVPVPCPLSPVPCPLSPVPCPCPLSVPVPCPRPLSPVPCPLPPLTPQRRPHQIVDLQRDTFAVIPDKRQRAKIALVDAHAAAHARCGVDERAAVGLAIASNWQTRADAAADAPLRVLHADVARRGQHGMPFRGPAARRNSTSSSCRWRRTGRAWRP